MTLFICPAGTSVMGGPILRSGFTDLTAQIADKVSMAREKANGDRDSFLVAASAETNGLVRSGLSADDRVVFLATDTPEGRTAAEYLVGLTRSEFGCGASVRVVEGLQATDARRFAREGVDNLFITLDDVTRDDPPDAIRINATGGFKGVVPYLVLYAMVERIEVVYVYEWSNALIRLPALPVQFDWARLADAARAIFAVCDEGPLDIETWRGLLPTGYYAQKDDYNALFQFEDGFVSLSGPGFLVKRQIEASEAGTRIMLSRSAAAALRNADGTVRTRFETILARARNPMARRSGRHTETLVNHGSDLLVWKTFTNSAPRMLYWEDGNDLWVAELMTHEQYDHFRYRTPRRVGDYPAADFEAWDNAGEPNYADLASAAAAADRSDADTIAELREELKRARVEREAASAKRNQAVQQVRDQLTAKRDQDLAATRSTLGNQIAQARRDAETAMKRLQEREIYIEQLEGLLAEPEEIEDRAGDGRSVDRVT